MTYPGPAHVTMEDESTRNAEAVGLAYDHIIGRFGDVLAELLTCVPVDALMDVREELKRRAACFADDSMLPVVVRGMVDQGKFDPVQGEDFEWAFERGRGEARKAFARVAEGLPDN